MSKAILVMDMPKNCTDCPLRDYEDNCKGQSEEKNNNAGTWEELRESCPLRELPQKKKHTLYSIGAYNTGYNACIDDILKGSD